MENYTVIFGENIRRQRKRQHMTLEDLAELTQMQPSSIGKVERGQANPNFKTLVRFAEAFGMALPDLLLKRDADKLGTYLRDVRLSGLPEPNQRAARVLLQVLDYVTDAELDVAYVEMLLQHILGLIHYSTYEVVCSPCREEDSRETPVYGVHAIFYERNQIKMEQTVPDLSSNRRKVEAFVAKLNQNFASYWHFSDLLEDFIGEGGEEQDA